jgi:RNA polymerase sigma factor (sigma-70 family)
VAWVYPGGNNPFADCDDEALIAACRDESAPAAFEELDRRCRSWRDALIAGLAKRVHLQNAEMLDAQQNAFFWMREAVLKYSAARRRRGKESGVQGYFRIVLTTRFTDHVRHLVREESHLQRLADMPRAFGAPPAATAGVKRVEAIPDPHGHDPLVVAEGHEIEVRIAQAVRQLNQHDRRLFKLMVARTPIKTIARKFGVTEFAVNGQIARLREKLRAQLGDLLD